MRSLAHTLTAVPLRIGRSPLADPDDRLVPSHHQTQAPAPAVGRAAGRRAARRPIRTQRTAADRMITLLAELLIIAGAGTGLYVVWTMWWTDVASSGPQQTMVRQLGQTATKPGGTEHREAAPILQEPADVAAVFGTMRIPRFGADYERPIGEGTDRVAVLNTIGLGHYIGAPMPGAIGNFAVAGHRVTYGKPLNQIAELQPNDPIVVRVTDRASGFDTWYVYRVTDSQIVTPDHVEVIAPVPNHPDAAPGADDRWLTLTACHPMWSAAQRFVTHAKLDYWMPADEGTPKELGATSR